MGLGTQPWGDPVFRVRGLEVCLPTLTTWGLAVRKSRIQGHRGVFRPSSISLPASLLGTMVLKAELKSKNNILTYPSTPSDCQDERGSCGLPGRQHRLWTCLAGRRTAASSWRQADVVLNHSLSKHFMTIDVGLPVGSHSGMLERHSWAQVHNSGPLEAGWDHRLSQW